MRSQRIGHGFESHYLHQTKPKTKLVLGFCILETNGENMAITSEEKQKVLAAILDYLSFNKAETRKQVIEGVLDMYGFSDKEKQNRSCNSKCNKIRSYIGTVLTDMITNGTIVKTNNYYSLLKEKAVVVKEERCRNAILNFLGKRAYTKKDLYTALQKYFQTDKTPTIDDDNALKGLAGNVLRKLVDDANVILDDGKYSLAAQIAKKTYPKHPVNEETFEHIFIERLCDCGGKFFEKFIASLLEKYFVLTGRDVINCDIVGGVNDGGIDVVIDTVDELGFTEKIMIQGKCRRNAQITEKEVREFYGALSAKGGTKGMFVTTSTFHPSAQQFLLSIDKCVGIDANKLFDLAKRTTYGVRSNKDGYLFDEAVYNI